MSNTQEEFWKMVYEKEVAVIVMLSQLEEDDMVGDDTTKGGRKKGSVTWMKMAQ